MNNFILVNKTFVETTPESVAEGELSDLGMYEQDLQVTFSELVNLLKEHSNPSQSPNDGSIYVWYANDFHVTNYRTGTERQEAIHFSSRNTPNAAKYWKLAARIAHLSIKKVS